MKKYAIVLFSALFMFAIATQAQKQKEQKNPRKTSIEERVAKMTKDLSLSADEQAQVTTLFTKQDAEMKAFYKDNTNKESADYKPKKKELQTKHDAELKTIIGEEKFKKYQEIRKAERAAAKQADKKPE